MGTQTLTAPQARWTARPATLGAYVLSLAIGASVGWATHTVTGSATMPVAAGQPAAATGTAGPTRGAHPGGGLVLAAETGAASAKRPGGGPKRLILLLPGDGAFVSSTKLAVAGLAYARPHGKRIKTVSADLFVSGRLVSHADIEVSSSRFAGFLEVPATLPSTDAELRISDPTRQAVPTVVQSIRLDLG